MTRKNLLFFILVAVLRTLYGMTRFGGQDEFQIYLIGLKYYTSGMVPHWGPDIVISGTQIPGALQGWLTGMPFFLHPAPESPYILLNVLSTGALFFFAWYLCRRLPALPGWVVYGWLLLAPWTLHFSTHIENPSYLLVGSILFFVAVFELFPLYRSPLIRPEYCFFMLGFSWLWAMQLHLSWVLMLPYLAMACWWHRGSRLPVYLACLLAGALIPGIGLWPVFDTYGLEIFSTETTKNIGFHWKNLLNSGLVVARFFSFASYEVARFIGFDNPARLQFLHQYYWAAPAAILLWVTGFVQIGWMARAFFIKQAPFTEWNKVKTFTGATLLWICLVFLGSVAEPAAHTFYLMLPVAMWYGFYTLQLLANHRFFKPAAGFVLAGSVVFQIAVAQRHAAMHGIQHYIPQINMALQTRDYTLLGLRRTSVWEQQHQENTWKQEIAGGISCFQNDFEFSRPPFPQNICKYTTFEGRYSIKMDSIQCYGGGIEIPFDTLKQRRKIAVQLYLKSTGTTPLLMVAELAKGTDRSFWKAEPLETGNPEWQQRTVQFHLPDAIATGSHLALYAWLPEKNSIRVFIDQVKVCLE